MILIFSHVLSLGVTKDESSHFKIVSNPRETMRDDLNHWNSLEQFIILDFFLANFYLLS